MDCLTYLRGKGIVINNDALIENAFVHSSYVNEHKHIKADNERLEFMGDAVLQLWSSFQLFQLEQCLPEGKMTTLRAQLVCEKSLAEYARYLELNQFLKLGQGEEKTGGRLRDSINADMFEALLGALYIDSGMQGVDLLLNEVILPHLDHPGDEMVVDYKTKLQEYIQADNRKVVSYEVVSVSGPSNSPEFVIQVCIEDIILGIGKGKSKKKAEQNAAQDAFMKMVR